MLLAVCSLPDEGHAIPWKGRPMFLLYVSGMAGSMMLFVCARSATSSAHRNAGGWVLGHGTGVLVESVAVVLFFVLLVGLAVELVAHLGFAPASADGQVPPVTEQLGWLLHA
jgi:hypothetical protein